MQPSTSPKKINDLAKEVGADILYLSPYSPDFNETEQFTPLILLPT